MKLLTFFLVIFAGLCVASADWDTNFHLFKYIQDGNFSEIEDHLTKMSMAMRNITTNNILATICSFFPESTEINPQTMPEIFENEEDEANIMCFVQSLELIRNACFGQIWPFLVLDSWAKIQSGFASGNFRNPGHFTQCINLKVPMENEFAGPFFEGKHCNYGIGRLIEGSFNVTDYPPFLQGLIPEAPLTDIGALIPEGLPLFIDVGICVPKICSNRIIDLITRLITFLVGLGPTELTSQNLDKFCNVKENPPFGAMEWAAASLIIAGFAGCILSTIYELICVNLKYETNEMTAAMSLYSNGKYLFSLRRHDDRIQCLYGLRALALIWIMLGYRFIIPLIVPLINPIDFVTDFMDGYFAPWIFASQFGVDALLFLNATLITYLFMQKMQKSGHVKLWKFYIYRLMRVTPIIGILIFFMMTLTPYQSSGPYYRFLTEAQIPACEDYWWAAMFHVQNYVNPETLCILHTYFFSIDMQLFWAAPLLLFPLFFFGAWFTLFVFLVFCLSVACATTIAHFYGFQAFFFNMIVDFDKLMAFLRMIYFATHTRMAPWLIGVLCGYIVFRLKDRRKINWFFSALLWIISISGIIAVVYLLYPFHQVTDNQTSHYANVFYIGFARNVFAICLMWFVIGSYTGTGSLVSWILSLAIWQPISKMGISIYIVSLSAQMVMIASWKTPYVFGISEMLQAFNSDILIVLLFSTVAYLMIERPVMRITKFLLRIGQKKVDEKDELEENQLTFDRTNPWKSFY